MFGNVFKTVKERTPTGTTVEPLCNIDPTTVANSYSEETKHFLKDCFKSLKHQSHANLV